MNKIILLLILNLSIITASNCCCLIISIPKSGTHLIGKAILEITGKEDFAIENSKELNGDLPLMNISANDLDKVIILSKNYYLKSHLFYSKTHEDLLFEKKQAIFFNIRDPRDQAISYAHWQKDLPEHYPHAITMTLDEILTDIIKNINNFYTLWLLWMDYPFALTVRFEDLVGSKGGGDDAKQLATVKAIAKHVSVELSEERAQEIATDLFGITKNTFRKGQIGAWKHEFTAEHKELFKQYGGELLIKLGYEKDLDW